MAEKSREAGSETSHEILRHLKLFSRLHLKEIVGVLDEATSEWNDDNVERLGASLAFFTLLSLAPLVVVAVGAAVFGREAAQGQLAWEIRNLAGPVDADAIQELIRGAYKPVAGAVATLLSILTLAFGASSVAVELHNALNTIWHVPAKTGRFTTRVVAFAKERFFSFLLVLGGGPDVNRLGVEEQRLGSGTLRLPWQINSKIKFSETYERNIKHNRHEPTG